MKQWLRAALAAVLAGAMLLLPGCGGTSAGGEAGYQLEMPQEGEEVAVIVTNMGEIKLRLFPEAAPKTVENFVTHAKDGYYDGLTFHRVIDDFMIQGGDPDGDGSGGESIWGGTFEDEFNENLLNLRGAVAMANRGKDTNGSQFFINQAGPDAFPGWEMYEQGYEIYEQSPEAFLATYGNWLDMSKISDKVKELYEEYGGNANLDGAFSLAGTGHTVFAQVYEGMDVVDAIAAVSTDGNNKPLEPVTIETIRIETYGA